TARSGWGISQEEWAETGLRTSHNSGLFYHIASVILAPPRTEPNPFSCHTLWFALFKKEISMTQPKARYRRVPGVASLIRSWPIVALVPALLASTSTSAGAVNSSIVSNFNGTGIPPGL